MKIRRPLAAVLAGAACAGALAASTPCSNAWSGPEPDTYVQLKNSRYAAVEAKYAALQADWAAGRIDDTALLDGFAAFNDPDPTIASSLGAWAEADPRSYVARLAQGMYYDRQVWAARGCGDARRLDAAERREMAEAEAKARAALLASLPLVDKPLLSWYWLVDLSRHEGEGGAGYAAAADRAAPANTLVRRAYLSTLQTRWGGSGDEMADYLARARKAGLAAEPARQFEAMVEQDRAWVAYASKDMQATAAHGSAAIALVGDGRYLAPAWVHEMWQMTAYADEVLGRKDEACRLYKLAGDAEPGNPWVQGHLAACPAQKPAAR